MKIAIEITIDENAWLNNCRKGMSPFERLDGDTLQDSLAGVLLEWAGDAPSAIATHVLKPGTRMELLWDKEKAVANTSLVEAVTIQNETVAALINRIEQIERWAARACGDWEFNSDAYISGSESAIESIHDRLSALESGETR